MLRGLLRNTIVLCLGLIGLVCVSWLFSAPSKEQRGVWATEGYGLFLDIGRTVIDVYQVTDVSCHRGMRIPAHLWAVEMLEGATFHIQDARLKLDVSGTLQPIFADRVDSLPDQCGADFASTDLATNYAVFWHAMAEHYPFFELHGVDWSERRAPQGATLWEAITTAMTGLDDGHLYIYDGEDDFSPSQPPDWYEDRHAVRDATRARVKTGLTRIANAGLEVGLVTDTVAYVYINHMNTDAPLGQANAATAAKAFEKVLRAYPQAEAYILDVRYNPGGSDDVAMAYADFFATSPTPAFTKSTRTRSGYTAPTLIQTEPQTTSVRQPVYVLTSPFTGSAAEIFTLALRELPNVTRRDRPVL